MGRSYGYYLFIYLFICLFVSVYLFIIIFCAAISFINSQIFITQIHYSYNLVSKQSELNLGLK